MILRAKHSVTQDQRTLIREFCKDYNTEDLTVVLTDQWNYKPHKYDDRTYTKNKYALKKSVKGMFFNTLSANEHVYDIGGFKKIKKPFILINMGEQNWLHTFLHEFGHYIDYKTNTCDYYQASTKQKEKFANDFADLAIKKYPEHDKFKPIRFSPVVVQIINDMEKEDLQCADLRGAK